MSRKQQLLKAHRKKKRLSLVLVLLLLLALSISLAWYTFPIAILLVWIIHEAWFADHIFYSPKQDYCYDFSAKAKSIAVDLNQGSLQLEPELLQQITPEQTLVLEIEIRSRFLGAFFDPTITIGDDKQVFERGCSGKRYVNLTGQSLQQDLRVKAKFCHIAQRARLHIFPTLDLANKRIMVIAPHADDAELAAFALYSRHAELASIITVTQGEIEAESVQQQFGLPLNQAAQLKGRLRAWDSMAIPLWGGVKQSQCVQLGYYCMQLSPMLADREQSFASLQSGESDIRSVRQWNPFSLASDQNGKACGRNLIEDLQACIEHYQPELVVLPHPDIDPHPDHQACYQALAEVMSKTQHSISMQLLYANHLHDNDRWPMGDAYTGVALPPWTEEAVDDGLYSIMLNQEEQVNKASALLMQHDLQQKLSFKRRLRRIIQTLLTGRRWPSSGDNEYLRKAVRRHEIFWIRKV